MDAKEWKAQELHFSEESQTYFYNDLQLITKCENNFSNLFLL